MENKLEIPECFCPDPVVDNFTKMCKTCGGSNPKIKKKEVKTMGRKKGGHNKTKPVKESLKKEPDKVEKTPETEALEEVEKETEEEADSDNEPVEEPIVA
jgi:hypothetical protein